jgi:hypothetical protein
VKRLTSRPPDIHASLWTFQAFVGNNLTWITTTGILLLLSLGALLTLRRSDLESAPATGVFLVFGLWALARVLDVLLTLADNHFALGTQLAHGRTLSVDAFGTLVIVVATANLFLRRRGGASTLDGAVLMVALLVSTAVAHADVVVPRSLHAVAF